MNEHLIVVDDEWERQMTDKGWTVNSTEVILDKPLELEKGDTVEIRIYEGEK